MTSLESLLKDASSFITTEFGLNIVQSRLKLYSPENWQKFCNINSFDVSSSGIYIPVSYSAYVRTDSPFLISNIFHELYGHGLFVEHSQIGKKLIEIIRNNGDEKSFMFDEVNSKKQIFGIAKYNIYNYEGFAVWLEALLSEETGNSKIWNIKKSGLRKDYYLLFELFEEAENKLSRFGLISQMGFPKYYNENKVVELIKKLYGSKFSNIEFIILYGSKKPKSDIDLCIISTNPSNQYFNGWLDIAELNKNDFQKRIDNLDIALTDAMFTGKLIYGNQNRFIQYKERIIKTPITKDIVKYNQRKSKLQRDYLSNYKNNDRMKKLCLSYIDSFSKNAEQLSLGNKPLTLKNLKQLYKK